MGYTTEFTGKISVNPPLNSKEIEYLNKFSETRRVNCTQGPYYVDRGGFMGQDSREEGIIEYSDPPPGQPGLWCQWIPSEDGKFIEWNESEKFYYSDAWMKYLIDHFVGVEPIAKKELPFLQGHTLIGEIEAQGEDHNDRWVLKVVHNTVSRIEQPRLGDKVECPCCGEEFRLDK